MLFMKTIFCFVLCLATIKFVVSRITIEQKTNIEKSINKKIDFEQVKNGEYEYPFFSLVKIFGKEQKMRLYIHKPGNMKLDLNYKMNAFYVLTNCNVADWIKNKLLKLIREFPLLYQPEFYGSEPANIVGNNFKNISETLANIDTFINIFLSVLVTLIKTEIYILSNNTIVLRAIFELKFKIEFIRSLYDVDDPAKNKVSSDFDIIRLCLRIINRVHSFLITSCHRNISPGEDNLNNILNEFSDNTDDTRLEYTTNFLKEIKQFNLALSLRKACSVRHFLLENIVIGNLQNDISDEPHILTNSLDEIRSATVIFNNKELPIKAVIERVRQSMDDIEIVFRCQKIVLSLIMKAIYQKTLSLLKEHVKVPTEIDTEITDIQSEINSMDIPKDLSDYINYLVSAISKDVPVASIIDEVKIKIKSLNNVKLKIEPNVQFKQLLVDILKYKKSFECFNELFIFLSYELNRYHIPFKLNLNDRKCAQPNAIDLITDNVPMCDIIQSAYLMCLEMIIITNRASDSESETKKSTLLNNLCEKFELLKEYLLKVILFQEWKVDDDNNTFAYNIVVFLENQECSNWKNYTSIFDDFQRHIDLMMTELNDFGIENCSKPPTQSFLLFNNIDLNEVGEIKIISERVRNSLQISSELFDRPLPNLSHLNLRNFYGKTEEHEFFNYYKSYIMFFWKGEKTSIDDIYKHLMSLITLHPRFIHEIYVIHFKLYVTAFYYELNNVYLFLRDKNFTDIKEEHITSLDKSTNRFSKMVFPNILFTLVDLIKKFANYLSRSSITEETKSASKENVNPNEKRWKAEEIDEQIKNKINEHFIVIEAEIENDIDHAITNLDNVSSELKRLYKLYY